VDGAGTFGGSGLAAVLVQLELAGVGTRAEGRDVQQDDGADEADDHDDGVHWDLRVFSGM